MFGGQARAQEVESWGLEVICQADKGTAQGCFDVVGIHHMRHPVRGWGEGEIAFWGTKPEHAALLHERVGTQRGLFLEAFEVGDQLFGMGFTVGGDGAGHLCVGKKAGVDGDRFVVVLEKALDHVTVADGFGVEHGWLSWADIFCGGGRCRSK